MHCFASYNSYNFRPRRLRPKARRQRSRGTPLGAALRRRCAVILFALTLAALPIAAFTRRDVSTPFHNAQQTKVDEEKLTAVIIWKFLLFIDFPPEPSSERFIIGVIGASRVESYLTETVKNKTLADGRVVEVRRIQSLDELAQCHLVYIAPSENGRLSQILAKIRGRNIVSIGRSDDFLARGGMINFYIENTNLRFEYNNDEIMTANKLRFSSQLLRIGKQFSKAKE